MHINTAVHLFSVYDHIAFFYNEKKKCCQMLPDAAWLNRKQQKHKQELNERGEWCENS